MRETLQVKQASICDETAAEAELFKLLPQFPKLEDAQAVVSDARALGAEGFQIWEAGSQDVQLVVVDPSAVVDRQVLDRGENRQAVRRQEMAPMRQIQSVEVWVPRQQVSERWRWVLV